METKHFLGINWKVRSKHPQFWISIALSVLVPPFVYAGIEFSQVTSWPQFFGVLGGGFANPYVVLMIIVSLYNSITDKTTKGFGDSYIAKQYLKPRTDYDPKQAIDWEVNLDKKAQAKQQVKQEQEEKLKAEQAQQEQEEQQEVTEDKKEDKPMPETKMSDEMYDQYYTTQTKDDGLDDGKPLRAPVEYDESQPFTDDSEDVEFTIVDIADNTPQPKEQEVTEQWEDDNNVKGANPDDPENIPTKPPENVKEEEGGK